MTVRPAPARYGDGAGGHLEHDSARPAETDPAHGPQRTPAVLPGPPVQAGGDRPPTAASPSQDLPVAPAIRADDAAVHADGRQAPSGQPSDGVLGETGAPVPAPDACPPPWSAREPGAGPHLTGPQLAAPHIAGAELLVRIGAELPALGVLAGSDLALGMVVAGWLAGFRSPRTRRAYAGDLLGWWHWCRERHLEVLTARRVQVDLHVTGLIDGGAAAASVARRLSALSSFYRFAAGHDLLLGTDPTAGVRRPGVDRDATTTLGLTAEAARALVAAADADGGAAAPRTAALVRLLLHNALRVDELTGADLSDLATAPGRERVHRTLTVTRKGGRRAVVALAPATWESVEAYLEHRATAGVARDKLAGPLVATRTGGRLTQKYVWELVRRLARTAGLEDWQQLSPQSLRHTAITAALDGGATLRDVQDYAGHRDPRTTRRYDHTRASLDRSAAYLVAGTLT